MTLKVDYGILVRHRNCHGGGEPGKQLSGTRAESQQQPGLRWQTKGTHDQQAMTLRFVLTHVYMHEWASMPTLKRDSQVRHSR